MLEEMRKTVDSMWSVVEDLDKKGLGMTSCYISKDMDLRHNMKCEIIYMLLKIHGFENMPNDTQLQFLQYVIHAPINKDNKKEYVDSFKNIRDMSFNYLLIMFVVLDKQARTKLASLYMGFLSTLVQGYVRLSDQVDSDMLVRFHEVMLRNERLIEAGLGKKCDIDHFSWISDEMKAIIEGLYQLKHLEPEEDDEVFKVALDAVSEKDEPYYSNYKFEIVTDDDDDQEDNDDESEDSQDPIVTETVDDPIGRLDSLTGLSEVKKEVKSILNLVRIREECKKRGIERQSGSFHMVFIGNAGTGKTTVARLVAQAFHEMGFLSKGHLVEVGRADLIAGYVGQTAMKVEKIVSKAKGGVLFIDEAYSLTQSDDNFSAEAIATLIKEMEDNREDLVVIVAGYPALMHDFLNANPGMKSRFSKVIEFPDYSAKELSEIFEGFCKENKIEIDSEIRGAVKQHYSAEIARKKDYFGNARDVRTYFEQTLINQANRLSEDEDLTDDEICELTLEDLPKRGIINKMRFQTV